MILKLKRIVNFMSTLILKLFKTGDKIEFKVPAQKQIYENYIKALEQGQEIEIFVSPVLSGRATNAQIAKVHKCIRDIHAHTGEDFENIKLMVKQKSGLLLTGVDTFEEKSFADCTREEINTAIQAAIKIVEALGINLY